jgi:hypothetical protein
LITRNLTYLLYVTLKTQKALKASDVVTRRLRRAIPRPVASTPHSREMLARCTSLPGSITAVESTAG